jgi:hypothetical protein
MFSFLKEYNSLPNFMVRKTIFLYKRLHIRLHTILTEDKTPFLHNHPFYYVSVILKNGYTEEYLDKGMVKIKDYKIGSIIYRTPKDYHRIKSISGETKTLFITWTVPIKWSLRKHPDVVYDFETPKDNGIYLRNIKGIVKYCKFDDFWFIGSDIIENAINETRLSIHQCISFNENYFVPL